MKNKLVILTIFAIAIVATYSCEKEPTQSSSKKTHVAIRLTDAPADYEAVLIDLQDVLINRSGDDEGWTSIENVEKGIYNLLDLTGGVDTLIAFADIDTGMISQIRLVLGDNNALVIDEDTTLLSTPSAQQSGLKIKINQRFTAGLNYQVLLDFDAAKSVVKAGNSGKYNLKPVIRTIIEAQDGGISGSIADSIHAVIYAIQNTDSISTYTDSTGFFMVKGLNEGIYALSIVPESGWNDTTLNNIHVVKGSISNVGYIELKEE